MAIRKLLVANRAEIAARIFRTARAMDIATVAVFSDPDAGLPYVRDGRRVGPAAGCEPGRDLPQRPGRSSRRRKRPAPTPCIRVTASCRRTPTSPPACAAAGLTFVGPSPAAIAAMGSKIAAKELMAAAGVPVLPGVAVPGGPSRCSVR